MSPTERIHTTLTQLAIWTAQNPFSGRLIILALPLTFAVAAAVLLGHPVPTPPCGSGSGGGGSC